MTDCIRGRFLKCPVFTYQLTSADDGGSGTYQGFGYKVEVKKSLSIEYGVKTIYVKIYMFGKEILAFYE